MLHEHLLEPDLCQGSERRAGARESPEELGQERLSDLRGEERAFDSFAGEVTLESVIASYAVPGLFRAERVGGGVLGRVVLAEPAAPGITGDGM
ncbi:MAG: hypothetical protein ACR2KW_12305 [Rubrobacter sp.]